MTLKLTFQDYDLLKLTSLFEGVPSDEHEDLLVELDAMVRSFSKDTFMRRMGDELDFYPLLLEGSVRSVMLQGGEYREVARFDRGDTFAEAIPDGLHFCPVSIQVVKDARILCISAERLRLSENPHAIVMRNNIAKQIPKRLQELSKNLMVLGQPRLSEKVIAYLKTLPRNDDGSVTVPLSRKDWANYLRVSDKSLIRELGALHRDGVLRVDGRAVWLLDD